MEKRTLSEVLADPNSDFDDVLAAMPPDVAAEIEADMDREIAEWKDGFGEFVSKQTGKPYEKTGPKKSAAKKSNTKKAATKKSTTAEPTTPDAE